MRPAGLDRPLTSSSLCAPSPPRWRSSGTGKTRPGGPATTSTAHPRRPLQKGPAPRGWVRRSAALDAAAPGVSWSSLSGCELIVCLELAAARRVASIVLTAVQIVYGRLAWRSLSALDYPLPELAVLCARATSPPSHAGADAYPGIRRSGHIARRRSPLSGRRRPTSTPASRFRTLCARSAKQRSWTGCRAAAAS
jgi:hypothetical protein